MIIKFRLFENKDESEDYSIEYRGIPINVHSEQTWHPQGRYYTLGKFYRSIDDAKSKIDRYWDYDEDSDSVFDY